MRRTFILASALAMASCIDPAHDDAVAALGPEASGVDEGPTHRPGQPCLTCHGGSGPGPDFAAAGTVYETRDGTTPMPDVTVILRDSSGATRSLVTNRVGNFYVTANQWTPVYPMFAELRYQDVEQKMLTRIGRNGGCAECHRAGNRAQMPPVYLREP